VVFGVSFYDGRSNFQMEINKFDPVRFNGTAKSNVSLITEYFIKGIL
jgi:hypothetical protein